MNRKLYTKIYRDNPADPTNPIYIGGYYEKRDGLPAKRFRLLGSLIAAAAVLTLAAAGLVPSAPGRTMYVSLPYAVAFLPAVLCLFAFLQAPGDDGRVREDTWHNVFERIQACSAIGLGLTGIALTGGVVAAVLAGTFGMGEGIFLGAMALSCAGFFALRRLWRGQTYDPPKK